MCGPMSYNSLKLTIYSFFFVVLLACPVTYNFSENKYVTDLCEKLGIKPPKTQDDCVLLLLKIARRYADQLLVQKAKTDPPNDAVNWEFLLNDIESKYKYAELLLEELEIDSIPETDVQWAEIKIRMKQYVNNLLDSQIQHSVESLLRKDMNEPPQFKKSFLDLADYFKLIPRGDEVKILNKFGVYNLKWSIDAIKNDSEAKSKTIEDKTKTIELFSNFCKRFSVAELLRFGIERFISNFFQQRDPAFNKVDKCYAEFIKYNMKRSLQLQNYVEEIVKLSRNTENCDVDFQSKWAEWKKGLHIDYKYFPKVPFNVEIAATCLKDGLLRLWNSSNAEQALKYWKKDIPDIWSKMDTPNENGEIVYSKDDIDVMETLSRAPPDYLRNLKFENEIKLKEEDKTSKKIKSYAATLFYSHLKHAKKYKKCVWIFDFNNCADVIEMKKNLSDIWHISEEDFCENFYYLWCDTSNADFHGLHYQLVKEKCKPSVDDIKDYAHSISLKYPHRAIAANVMFNIFSAGIISNSSILESS